MSGKELEQVPTVIQASHDDRQPSQDFELGFWSGAIHGCLTRRHRLSLSEQEVMAFRYFQRETKLGAKWLGAFVQGWLAGYQAYFDGLI
jgi:hypothetical protein